MHRNEKLKIFILILIFQIFLLLIFVLYRYIDADEGFYLMASFKVWSGDVPYLDFFYPQMPLLPYLYSLISHFGFVSLFSGRLMSVILSISLGLLLFWYVKKFWSDEKVPLLILFLYAFNGLILSWNSVVKTFAFSNLFAFLSFIFFTQAFFSEQKRFLNIFLSGIFIGLAFNCRSVFFLIFLAQMTMILVVFPKNNIKNATSNFLAVLSGGILSSLLGIYLFLKDSYLFTFNNLGYHQLYGEEIIRMGLWEKFFILSKFLLYPQNLFILSLTIFSTFFLIKKRRIDKELSEKDVIYLVAFIFAIIILVSYFLAPITQLQYYHQALPYLLFLSAPGLSKMIELLSKRRITTFGVCGGYLVCLIPFLLVFIFTVRERDRFFMIDQVKKVVHVVEKNSDRKDVIISDWPGYPVLARRDIVRGTETCGYIVSHLLTKDQLKHFNILSERELKNIVENKEVNLIITGVGSYCTLDNLIYENYDLLQQIGDSKIFLKK